MNDNGNAHSASSTLITTRGQSHDAQDRSR